jgi:hypothetical protein
MPPVQKEWNHKISFANSLSTRFENVLGEQERQMPLNLLSVGHAMQ